MRENGGISTEQGSGQNDSLKAEVSSFNPRPYGFRLAVALLDCLILVILAILEAEQSPSNPRPYGLILLPGHVMVRSPT